MWLAREYHRSAAPAARARSAALSDLLPLPFLVPNLPGTLSRIDTITIGRRLLNDPSPEAALNVIAAQEVRRVVIGGRLTRQLAGPFNDDLFLTPSGRTRLHESLRRTIAET